MPSNGRPFEEEEASHQNAGQNHKTQITNKLSENIAKFKCF
jgi:hypothetical protein